MNARAALIVLKFRITNVKGEGPKRRERVSTKGDRRDNYVSSLSTWSSTNSSSLTSRVEGGQGQGQRREVVVVVVIVAIRGGRERQPCS